MFAVVRTGGKQYRVAAGDKIAVEKLAGEAGETIQLGDVLLAGDGDDIKDTAKVAVSAEIIAQAKSEKTIVFKKKRRHNYRRKAGHRQQMTLLRITQVGDSKYVPNKDAGTEQPAATKAAPSKDDAQAETSPKAAAEKAPAKTADAEKTAPKKAATRKAAAEEKPAAKKSAAKKTEKK